MKMSRREAVSILALGGAALAVNPEPSFAQGAAAPAAPPAGPYALPPLPYPVEALEPHIDAQTMTIHHGKHHQA